MLALMDIADLVNHNGTFEPSTKASSYSTHMCGRRMIGVPCTCRPGSFRDLNSTDKVDLLHTLHISILQSQTEKPFSSREHLETTGCDVVGPTSRLS